MATVVWQVFNVGSQDAVELPFDSGSEVNYCFVIGQVEDCNGVLGGDGVLDECGVCDNDPGNDGFLDECGTCDSDPTNDCEQDCEGTWGGDVTECGNTTVWLSCDENFEEIRWGLFDEDFMFVTDGQGAASEADEYIALDFDLAPGTYNFGIFDAGDNGGCEVEVRVFGDFAAGESTDGYTGRSLLEFVVPEPPLGTIVDLVVESPQFSTLEAAVVAAGLADDLSAEGPFTVFAPTDDAFAALPEGTLDTLLADPTGDLPTSSCTTCTQEMLTQRRYLLGSPIATPWLYQHSWVLS